MRTTVTVPHPAGQSGKAAWKKVQSEGGKVTG